MYYWEEDGVDESFVGYQKSVRARASESLEELRQSLSGHKLCGASPEAKSQLSDVVNPRHLAYAEAAYYLKQHLEQQKVPRESGSPHKEEMDVPNLEETVSILQSQAGYMQQLEAENRYIKEELSAIRQKMSELIVENRQLHDELKSSVLQEIIHEGGSTLKTGGPDLSGEVFEAAANRGYLERWQTELQRLHSLYEGKTKRLESQLASAKAEVSRYEKTVEDLRTQLRMQVTEVQVATREDGTSGNFVFSDTHTNIHLRTINTLTRERDEQLEFVRQCKNKIRELEQREEEAYQQIKKGIELVEQAQLEQTEAIVQKEQLAEELEKMKERFTQLLADSQSKMDGERTIVRKENEVIVKELTTKLKELTESQMNTQNLLDRVTREKTGLINELEDVKLQLRKYDKEVTMAADSYRSESTNATIQRQQALHEVTRLRSELQQCEKERDQERSKYRAELEELRRRLNRAEKELVNAKEECIHYTSNIQELEGQLHLAKMARDSVERGRTEDLKALTRRTQQREQELSNYIDDIEHKHTATESEMNDMLKTQNNLIGRLREECRRQAAQLAKIVKKHRAESGQLRKDNDNLRLRLERSVARVSSLEEQVDQHARLHNKMRQRLKMMDDHAQHQSQQVLDLLSRQSSLMKDRQLLARELEFLRSKLIPGNESDLEKLFTSGKGAVDEVLSAVSQEKADGEGVWSQLINPPKPLGAEEDLLIS